MSFFDSNRKRKPVSALVKGTIEPAALSAETLNEFVKNFSIELPRFFFDNVGDGNVAGLILAALLENNLLNIKQVDASGYIFIKFAAEMDPVLFEMKAPRILEHIRSLELLKSNPDSGATPRSFNT
jgi:hypothetical protein